MARSQSEYLVLDIETIPDDERWQRPDASDGRGYDSFPPTWAHRIVVIGCLWLDHGYSLKHVGVFHAPTDTSQGGEQITADDREQALLEQFSRFVGEKRPVLVTYNGRGFDLPVIALRSLCHGVPQRWYYREPTTRARYSEQGHLDVCDWLADHGATRLGSLDSIARLIGLPGKTGVDGSQVERLYRAGELAAIQRYCLSDVAQTALLFLRFRLLQGVLSPTDYCARVDELLAGLAADGRVPDVVNGVNRAQLLRTSL
ncbi:MAG TPA: ribonuclease H-like domain-containing protein [Kofleriaceae bacterium]